MISEDSKLTKYDKSALKVQIRDKIKNKNMNDDITEYVNPQLNQSSKTSLMNSQSIDNVKLISVDLK